MIKCCYLPLAINSHLWYYTNELAVNSNYLMHNHHNSLTASLLLLPFSPSRLLLTISPWFTVSYASPPSSENPWQLK